MNGRKVDFTNDIRALIREVVSGVVGLSPTLWDEPAGSLSWTRWETAEHMADDLLVYAATLAAPDYPDHMPFATTRRRDGAPDEMVHCNTEAGAAGLAAVIESSSRLFVALVDATPPEVTAAHVYGRTDAEGFAAMATVELLVHGHDVFSGTNIHWAPDDALCRRILARLFPDVDVPSESGAFSALLWATGRQELPGKPLRTEWRWYNRPAAESGG